ncbi:MAG: C2 domain-containing protein [Euryarchaeota archaeon]|nr:C2 domain-containing protein [Euryarchaeota archaeon]
MKIDIKKLLCLVTLAILVISIDASALKTTDKNYQEKPNDFLGLTEGGAIPSPSESGDLDPLVDLAVTVTIKEIRALGKIDLIGDPDFYVKLIIDGVEHTSPIWHNQKHVESNWSITQDVPDDKEFVNITIQLWDKNVGGSKLCDISPNGPQVDHRGDYEANLMYSLKSAHWTGDDYIDDPSGYGRLNGCDDNSIYQNDRDCELLFDITQNDYDGDGIPYWTEVNVFGTDPTVDNQGWDNDSDGVPIEWEFKWGHYFEYDWHNDTVENKWIYDPFVWEDHRHLDPDEDGLDNIEEYLTSQWGSDPFRKDIFIELDQMEVGPNGEGEAIPELSKEVLRDSYGKHNIYFHLDDGNMGGGEMIPFNESTTDEELREIYWNYFLHGDEDNWRQGVFRYALIIYNSSRWPGFNFWSGYDSIHDSFQISTKYFYNVYVESVKNSPVIRRVLYGTFDKDYCHASIYAGTIMHETGHTLGIYSSNTPGCDNSGTLRPWHDWLKWLPYRSCMNYWYTYIIVDYSDGSNGKNDFDDWARIDLTLFQGD